MRGLTFIDPTESLSLYLNEIRNFPMLEAEDEHQLAVRLRDHGDTAAAQRLAEAYLRLVVSIAKKYRGYGLPLGDLIAEGNVGLMEAIARFDPERGARLATYAPWWIRAAIHDYVMRSVSVVRMGTSAPQKKLFFNLRRLAAEHSGPEEVMLSPETARKIARQLGVKETDVVEMNQRLRSTTLSLNAQKGEETDLEFQDLLIDGKPLPETVVADAEEYRQRQDMLVDALDTLTERERDILTERRLREDPLTLEELGQRYGVTRERIRQIEFKAFEKVQGEMIRVQIERDPEAGRLPQ